MKAPVTWRVAMLLLCFILQVTGVAFFARGFFPYKKVLPGFAQQQSAQDFLDLGLNPLPPAPKLFDRLVFILIDALRSDFVFSNTSAFTFIQSKIRAGHALPFTAHAKPPTVTLPRIKALTTGSIPNFLDAILNIAESDTSSTLAFQDTWLVQANISGSKLVMYGDDTWIKLFPGLFARSDGTSSFFVSDYTEVDNNVTRHLDEELVAKDWDVLILHYLGLDHIGHLGGPRSIFMEGKQREMDGIIERIYNSFTTETGERTVMMICGDHGMNDVRSLFIHLTLGRESWWIFGRRDIYSGCIHVALPEQRSQYPTITNQSSPIRERIHLLQQDSTIRSSSDNIRTARLDNPKKQYWTSSEVFPATVEWCRTPLVTLLMRDPKGKLTAMAANIIQISKLVQLSRPEIFQVGFVPDCSGEDEIGCQWDLCRTTWNTASSSEDATAACYEYLLSAQSLLSGAATDYSVSSMYKGLIILLLSILVLMPNLYYSKLPPLVAKQLAVVTFIFGILMFGSSYVEEEHHFWYLVAPTHFLIAFIQHYPLPPQSGEIGLLGVLLQLPLIRIVSGWNQTGQKHAGAPDIVKELLIPNPHFLGWLVLYTYLYSGYMLYRNTFTTNDAFRRETWPIVLVGTAFLFKISMAGEAGEPLPFWLHHIPYSLSWTASLVAKARLSFIAQGLGIAWYNVRWIISDRKTPWITGAFPFLNLFLLGQSRYANIPLFLLFESQRHLLESSKSDALMLTFSCLIMQHVSFFALGNSNSLSSVDLSNAYNGISSYSIPLVGLLTFISNWAGPIWWSTASLQFLAQRKVSLRHRHTQKKPTNPVPQKVLDEKSIDIFVDWMGWSSWFHGMAISFLVCTCIILRTHLFIWTVFSPKFLFQAVWLGLHHIVVEGIMGGLIWLIS